jgi:hypothetical protein
MVRVLAHAHAQPQRLAAPKISRVFANSSKTKNRKYLSKNPVFVYGTKRNQKQPQKVPGTSA